MTTTKNIRDGLCVDPGHEHGPDGVCLGPRLTSQNKLVEPVARDLLTDCGWNAYCNETNTDAGRLNLRFWDCRAGPFYLFGRNSETPSFCPGCGRRVAPEEVVVRA